MVRIFLQKFTDKNIWFDRRYKISGTIWIYLLYIRMILKIKHYEKVFYY